MPVIYGQFVSRQKSKRITLGDPEQYSNSDSDQTANRQEGVAGVDVYTKQENLFNVEPHKE